MAHIRIERTHFSRGHIITLHTGDVFKDAIGVSHDLDGRRSLAAAWRDLSLNAGVSVADLKRLPRQPAYLRIRR